MSAWRDEEEFSIGGFEDLIPETMFIKIYVDVRRYGKKVTIIDGFDPKLVDLEEIAKMLKKKVAAGGTVKNGRIEIQGDHREKIAKILEDMGYTVEVL